MAIEKQRVEITNRVTGKFSDGQFHLYANDEQIGRMTSGPDGSKFELKEGYEHDQNRFYQMADIPSGTTQQYVDCDDENGWC